MLLKLQKMNPVKKVDIINTWSLILVWNFQYFQSTENVIKVNMPL